MSWTPSLARALAAVAATAAAATLGAASPAAAAAEEGRAFSIGARPVWFVTAGGTGGGSFTVGGARGGFLGGEVSVARLIEARFAGVYADAVYDFGAGATTLTAGPELGLIRRSRTSPVSFGIDGGGALRLDDGERAYGVTGRLFVGLAGSFTVYCRYAYLGLGGSGSGGGARTGGADDHVVLIGAALKFPIGPPFGAATRRAP